MKRGVPPPGFPGPHITNTHTNDSRGAKEKGRREISQRSKKCVLRPSCIQSCPGAQDGCAWLKGTQGQRKLWPKVRTKPTRSNTPQKTAFTSCP